MTRKPRGENLDERLKQELEKMLKDGYHLSPISRVALQKRLGLNSSSTLGMTPRAELIKNARKQQLQNAGLDSDGKKRRNTLLEQNEELRMKNMALEKEKTNLIEQIAMLINGIQAKGYNLDELMLPLRRKLKRG